MADQDKTQTASPKKREDARKKGQVGRSVEVNSVLNLLVVFIVLKLFGGGILLAMQKTSAYFWGNLFKIDITPDSIVPIMSKIFLDIVIMLLPVFASAFLVAILSNVIQVGFHMTPDPLKPNFNAINPTTGFKRIFSKRTMVELLKAFIKIGIIGYLAYSSVKKIINDIFLTPLMDIDNYFIFVSTAVYKLAMKIILTFIVFALIDYLYQKWEFEESIKMTKQEVKDELRQLDGDPMIKARIRGIQREMARRRMISEIPNADVVITNPTHVAVALRYKEKVDAAPKIVAKGKNLIAEKIKQIAREKGIPVIENPPLARTLAKLEVGWEIPPEFFQTVAGILAYVYQLKGKIKLEEKPKIMDNINKKKDGLIADLGGKS